MTESCFIDPKHQPTPEEIRSALGSCFPLWERLTAFIEKSYWIEGTWSKWGPVKSGWNLRYRRNGKSGAATSAAGTDPWADRCLARLKPSAPYSLSWERRPGGYCTGAPQLRDGQLAVYTSNQRIRCLGCGEAATDKDATAPVYMIRARSIPTGPMRLE